MGRGGGDGGELGPERREEAQNRRPGRGVADGSAARTGAAGAGRTRWFSADARAAVARVAARGRRRDEWRLCVRYQPRGASPLSAKDGGGGGGDCAGGGGAGGGGGGRGVATACSDLKAKSISTVAIRKPLRPIHRKVLEFSGGIVNCTIVRGIRPNDLTPAASFSWGLLLAGVFF